MAGSLPLPFPKSLFREMVISDHYQGEDFLQTLGSSTVSCILLPSEDIRTRRHRDTGTRRPGPGITTILLYGKLRPASMRNIPVLLFIVSLFILTCGCSESPPAQPTISPDDWSGNPRAGYYPDPSGYRS